MTGCGRSGTKFTTHLIQDVLGLTCLHEVRRSRAQIDVSWKLAVDPQVTQNFRYVLHQVRQPLQCIASLQTFAWHIHHRKGRFATIPDIHPRKTPIHNSIVYWYHWNQLCESMSVYRYQIEALDAGDRPTIERFCDYLGCSDQQQYDAITSYCRQNHKINSRTHSDITWETIREIAPQYYEPILEMAARYGYDTPAVVSKKSA